MELNSIAALWPDQVETIVVAEVPYNIGLAIEVERWARIDNIARGFVHNFDSMICMVNHMRLKLNNVNDVDVVFVLVIFFLFHIVGSGIVILWENRLFK